jgi:hypothetical protein
MINYLQSITVFGVATGLQRMAASQQKARAIQADDGKTMAVESVRSLKELDGSVPMNEERLEERKHGLRTPQSDKDYLRSIRDRTISKPTTPFTRAMGYQSSLRWTGGRIDVLV